MGVVFDHPKGQETNEVGVPEENAVNLSIAFLNLKDNYDIDGFANKRQDILNALVACCPTRSAPYVSSFHI